MKKNTLIVMILLCVLVFGAYFIITNTQNVPQSTTPESYIYVDQNDEDSVRVFTFDMSLQGEASFTYSSEMGWCLDQNKNIPLKDQEVSALISTYSVIIASKRLDDPSDDISVHVVPSADSYIWKEN